MSSSLDIDAVEVIPPSRNEFGPSDLSDSASDSVGTLAEFTDSDSNGTGDRSSVESSVSPLQTEKDLAPDISPDRVVTSLEGGEEDDEDGESEGGDDTYEDRELDARDADALEESNTAG